MRRAKRALPPVAVVLVLALGVPLAGCGSESGARGDGVSAGKEKGVDMQEAAEQSDAMLDAVLKGIDPDVQWAHGPTTTRACGVTRRRTVMTVVSPERRQTFLDRAENFWRKNGYRIKAVNKDEKFPAVYAVTRSGFGVSVSFRGKGQAFLEADSPCVKESKVADPTTEPNGPAYKDVYPLPRPNVRSDFWSGKGP
ncbi:hypothetical protein AMK14_31195 [Streptomyces sp. TSRI0445]|uniref:hypothetical protein n=1 Tax=Streptomyces TaxID=1883 RepID=UPI0005C81626|nr:MULTISPECIES: hypothetical protein [Streptomyces]PPA41412.1 hypothetical protein BF14_017905 [Streptomyces griseus]RAN18738.1 hypothetical protein A3838_17465 [Streptomyces badius]AWL87558.1 hypothetical protein DIJ69_17895 [Streptomyces globisporus]OKI63134.1 hypothetical protein AMK14_31195 [Streptomyces sp. TSRI0445]RAN26637.1 hypothetical protein A3800_17475 [Streptomyces badius]